MPTQNQSIMRSVELLQSFASVQKNLYRFVQKSAADNGLSVPQYTVLITLISESAMTQKTIGEKTFLPKSTLSQAVDGLVKEGLLERTQVEGNRREVLLSVNEKGIEFIQDLHMKEGSVLRIFEGVLDSLEPQEVDGLLGTHARIASLLEAIELEE
ncbi:MarR family winged helix-turn-helix transcriptional regulator [Planomicrobium sp. CPCC 101110]|uniref:MarR family winged helix-turn-helix transcriptional regulator n=1 Tax=Planomicrobium sp. CPCC 101110 TaxID=2599619 RepID=UPI0011B78A24|nr:MarR family transcriptional regulator [Planomicrobium sp. CPCC 101110]TWT25327.1 MarR family transcriptional regulator [Planomicrobium sp. CPCC 101110]